MRLAYYLLGLSEHGDALRIGMSRILVMTGVKVEDIISLNFEEMDAPNDNGLRKEILMPSLLVVLAPQVQIYSPPNSRPLPMICFVERSLKIQ